MANQTPRPTPSPLRGLLAGVLLVLVLFPAVRAMLVGSVELGIGLLAGSLIAATVFRKPRPRPDPADAAALAGPHRSPVRR
jgi:hypothetical protein